MAKVKASSSSEPIKKKRPPLTPEARENRLISRAVDLAERQLEEGTASSQVIVHFLKLASSQEKLRNEKLVEENKLLKAKTEQINSMKRSEELMEAAIKAFRSYSGQEEPDDDY